MDARFAFTAQYWGDGAVISRAIEDRPGPIIEQQFGEFKTWTQAQNFASKLNQGLDLAPEEVRQIVTSSFLATACVIQEALNSSHLWPGSEIEREVHAAQLRFVLIELQFAMTLCRTASLLTDAASLCAFSFAQRSLRHARLFLTSFHGNDLEVEGLFQRAEAVEEALQSPPPRCGSFRVLPKRSSRDSGWLGHSQLALSYSSYSPACRAQVLHNATSDISSGYDPSVPGL